ncbi:hypothetical protein HMPREF9244_00716 [Alloscardovia omnicolens F0580]|uniref:Uncharacterized protein n=1 Tax=Alloscardovia omnicolens F0580 TaxID=1321816 RepID=U1SGF3_9BIFI|nr:hypothetical protein HMPREF9244_00716 [Alloscardovia omnicolens F0580]
MHNAHVHNSDEISAHECVKVVSAQCWQCVRSKNPLNSHS